MDGPFADVEEPQSINDEVLVCGPTAGPTVLCFWTISQRMCRSLAPGAILLPALIGCVSSTTLTTLGAGGFAISFVVVFPVCIVVGVIVVVVGT